jgi:hypothetical protein
MAPEQNLYPSQFQVTARDPVPWESPTLTLALAVTSSGTVCSDDNLGSDFLWSLFTEFDGVDCFTPFWGNFSSRLRRTGCFVVVFSSFSGIDLFFGRPSFGDRALVGGAYSRCQHIVNTIVLPKQGTPSFFFKIQPPFLSSRNIHAGKRNIYRPKAHHHKHNY